MSITSMFSLTTKNRVRWTIFFIVILAVFAGLLIYPNYYNKAVDWVNWKYHTNYPHFYNVPFRLGLDLQGGVHLVYQADVAKVAAGDQSNAVEGVRDVIERRVNAFGVAEPLVQTAKVGGNWQVIVELAGMTDVRAAIKMIGETPLLEFKEQNNEPQRALTAAEKIELDKYNKDAKVKADKIYKEVMSRNTDEFTTFVTKYSEDETTKGNKGNIGYIAIDGPYAAIYDKIRGLKPGMVSTIIQNSEGYNIALVTYERQGVKQAKARHLLICYKGATSCDSSLTKEEAKAKIDELKKHATVANFIDLVKQNSTEPGAKDNAGFLDWFSADQMVKEFSDVVFSPTMSVNTFSDVIETQFGYHIIYKIDERQPKEYEVERILIKTKTEADYLPPSDPWKNTGLSGQQLTTAGVEFNQNTGEAQVALSFNDEGKKLFSDITGRNVGKPVAIFLDGAAISVPTVQEKIDAGKAVISGNFTAPEAKLLAQRLNAGALPVPINLISQETIGPSLGQKSIIDSLRAGIIAFLIIALFMILFYRLPGLLAVIALLIYTSFVLAVFKLWPVTLTLAGLAGFIMSIGMAVDANILIFARMKEEISRGQSLKGAIADGFKRAWPSIRDSNFNTLITCFILIYFMTSGVRGFAITLSLGVLISMFTAIFVTRTLLNLIPTDWLERWTWLVTSIKIHKE